MFLDAIPPPPPSTLEQRYRTSYGKTLERELKISRSSPGALIGAAAIYVVVTLLLLLVVSAAFLSRA